jgi:hypothetical protein
MNVKNVPVRSARRRIADALERDESYDENPQGEPPITVPRYRRACRLLVTIDFPDEVVPPDELAPEARDGFTEGVARTIEEIRRQAAAILDGPPATPVRR